MHGARRGWLVGLGLMLSAGVAWAEQVAVAFPPGWTVSELAGPTVDGHVTPGSRRRAILSGPDGKLLAAIELTETPGAGASEQMLPAVAQVAQETAVAGYAKAGLKDRCASAAPVKAGSWNALQLDCTVSREAEPVLHQVIAMWATAGGFCSLSYTAPASSGQMGQTEFGQVLASVRVP